MASYSLRERFELPPKYFAIFDPGTYQFEKPKSKPNKAPFLSKAPRKTSISAQLWTSARYNAAIPHKITNITSFRSKQKRFPYEDFSAKDLNEILCRCGIDDTCECTTTEHEPVEIICQGKVPRRLFKGPALRSAARDTALVRKGLVKENPRFYDARVNESSAYYQGCKWSHRTSKRSQRTLEVRPGPADYQYMRMPTKDEICMEKFRAFKRKTSKQPRFIEIVQEQNIREGRPGPSSYHPKYPKGTDLQFLGPKANRFIISEYTVQPGPADHYIRRDFEPIPQPETSCQAKLPQPAGFGMKAERLIRRFEDGPSPATYNANDKLCQFIHCAMAPFGSSDIRFKPHIIEETDDDDIPKLEEKKICRRPMWIFKSKTIRFKNLVKKENEPSPADFLPIKKENRRSFQSQYTAPFHSSEGRFQPWYNAIPVHGTISNPYFYNLEKPKCLPAYHHGPLYRSERFPNNNLDNPAPNEYEARSGIETILKTHNKRLADNIENQHKFIWQPPPQITSLSYERREELLLKKCIDLLEPEELFDGKGTKHTDSSKEDQDETAKKDQETKLLRYFLYNHKISRTF